MKFLISIFFVINTCFARTPSSLEYQCDLNWKTQSEGNIDKKFSFRDSTEVKINNNLKIQLQVERETPLIKIIELFSDKPNSFLMYQFKCDRSLNCQGAKISKYDQRTKKMPLTIAPNTSNVVGSLANRDIFIYHSRPKTGFEYQYILYKDPTTNEIMGLHLECNEL
jgi:hypothetical protein